MNVKKMTCILCPTGCQLAVEWIAAPQPIVKRVRGTMCMKGHDYAIEAITRPIRTLTTTILVTSGIRRLTSVKTATPIPKQSIPHALRELKILTIPAPVYIGQIVIEDVAGTGIPVVATRDVAAKESSSGL
ncbi:DUF1667 domain-containing protein [Candidatus Acetothermia bacterium]|nr:DUF1667 domain-containing protein [Candidatus Acetothermia bacterium]MCI2427569.1 DUF1667 domain-containing protein [Candidatus Acetothermia bacterium]MCI2428241.1 DUF1667 domain-containing protein [Candidatus Acetothermia bacterium]